MKAEWIQAGQFGVTADWRPSYHFSQAMRLSLLGVGWPLLRDQATCFDGWRVSTNPASTAYDARVETAPVYRLRHVGGMLLHTDAEHWKTPEVSDQAFCVQPYDVLVRKVGRVKAALVSELTLEQGRVVQSNFHDYRVLRMNQMPAVEVHIVASAQPPSGVGEPATPVIAPAVANALFAATGQTFDRLPLRLAASG